MKPLLTILTIAALLSGCGDDGNGEFECTEQNTLCVTLAVPDDFTGKTMNLMGLLFAQVPPAGMPAHILATVGEPVIGINRPYDFKIDGVTQTGDFHFVVNLLMENGGTTMPVAGTDYVYWTTDTMNFDANPMTLGEVDLWLYE